MIWKPKKLKGIGPLRAVEPWKKKSVSSRLLWRMFREMCAVLQGDKIRAVK